MITMQQLSGGYSGKPVIEQLDLELVRGEFFTLIGPNGSGKSTLLQMLSGSITPSAGTIWLDGQPLQEWPAKQRAQKIAVLNQEHEMAFDFLVEDIVMLGRYPHQEGWIKTISNTDWEIVREAMALTNVLAFRHASFRSLSGGEKQRVLLAKALAQKPDILLLDEPTNHLDIHHIFSMLNVLKQMQCEQQLTIFAILHDLNVAALYSDRIGMMSGGKLVQVGDPNVLKDQASLEAIYQVHIYYQSHPTLPKPQLLLAPETRHSLEQQRFNESYRVRQDDKWIHIQFDQPLRSISNGVLGEGMHWFKHFCNFHVPMNYNSSDPKRDVISWLKQRSLHESEVAAMMTAVRMEDAVFMEEVSKHYAFFIMVTAGVGNAVDITKDCHALYEEIQPEDRSPGTINIMIFVEGHLTDGALVNAMLSATEAKAKALNDMRVTDPRTGTPATGTSTDSLLIAATQTGEITPYAGSGTEIGRMLGHLVYNGVKRAIANSRRHKPSERIDSFGHMDADPIR